MIQKQEETIYTCPMHPKIQQDKPGMCPECGMNLVKNHTGHNKHQGHHTEDFLKKFWIVLALTIPVVIWRDKNYLAFSLGSIVFWYGGWVFLASAWREIRARLPGMMTLIAIAIVTAYAYSVYTTISGIGMALYWELTTLITIMLLGHWIEMRAVSGAQGALKELSKLLPDEKVNEGDIIMVRPGGRIPADGLILEGQSEIDES